MTEVLISGVAAWLAVNAVMLWCCCTVSKKADDDSAQLQSGKFANNCDCEGR